MTLSILQKLQFIIVRFFIGVIYFFDWVAILISKKFLYKVVYYTFLAMFIFSIFYFSLNKSFKISKTNPSTTSTASLLRTGIVTTIYGVPNSQPNSQGNASNVLGSTNTPIQKPKIIKKIAFPYISAKSHLIVDNNSGQILSEHNINRAFAPASVTKLMTALVARDIYSEDEPIAVTPSCAEVESTKLWLPVGYEFSFKDILYSLLVSSAGDAGCMLASTKFDQETFVSLMNKKADNLGMKNTHFTNEVGLDGQNGSHYSSAWDLYLLSREAVKDSLIRQIVKTKEYSFSDNTGEFEVNISNTNKLLWEIPNSVGVKTGTTSGAGEVLLYQYQEDRKDITILVLSSEDRFLDTRNLLNWVLNSYQW